MAPLLRRAGSDDRAFERLYRRHVTDVYRYSLAVLGKPADAEDVTQTTFLNAYRAFQRGERPEKPENWLMTIAHNVCRQRFRQAARRPSEVAYEDEVGGYEQDSEAPTADDLKRAFSHLPSNQRAALVMRELEGRSYADIAEVLGVTVSALETLLFRARRALREQLEEQLTCREAELAVSRQLDGRLPHAERGALRAHLRACPECARLAQSQRAQRRVLRTLFAVPLPSGLSSFLGPHAAEAAVTTVAAAGGTGIAVKTVAVVCGAALVGGGTYEGVKRVPDLVGRKAPVQRVATRPATPSPAAAAVVAATPPTAPATLHAAAVTTTERGAGADREHGRREDGRGAGGLDDDGNGKGQEEEREQADRGGKGRGSERERDRAEQRQDEDRREAGRAESRRKDRGRDDVEPPRGTERRRAEQGTQKGDDREKRERRDGRPDRGDRGRDGRTSDKAAAVVVPLERIETPELPLEGDETEPGGGG